MNENEQELLNALRGLAADGPRQAPPHVEEFLVAELRRRSRGRHSKVWWSISAVAAIAAGIAVLIWMRPAPPRSAPLVASVKFPELPQPVEPRALPAAQKPQPIRKAPARPVNAPVSFTRCLRRVNYLQRKPRWWFEFNCRCRPCGSWVCW